MSGLEPSGPAQPPKSEAYTEAANPATQNPAEKAASSHGHGSYSTEVRGADSQQGGEEDGVAQSLGRGVHGSGPTNTREARETYHGGEAGQRSVPENENVDAEQVATYGEGEVADAVQRKSGTQRAPGEQPGLDDYAADLDR